MNKYSLYCVMLITVLAVSGSTGAVRAKSNSKQQTETRKLTKEDKKRQKEAQAVKKAEASVNASLKSGKTPRYNKLLKSTNYELMFREGLRYYSAKKKDKDYNSSANYNKAQSLFERAISSSYFTGTPQEDSLAYYFGASFYKNGDFVTSEQIFDDFRRRFPTSNFIEDVEYMYAMGFYFSSPEPEHDQTTTKRAIIAINEYGNRYPDTVKKEELKERTEEMTQKLYAKSYQNAKLYYTIGQYKAAVRALGNAIDEYPDSPYREELMYLAAKSGYLFARKSVDHQMTDRYMSMMDSYYNFVSEFPNSKHNKEMERMKAEAQQHIINSDAIEAEHAKAKEMEQDFMIGTAQ